MIELADTNEGLCVKLDGKLIRCDKPIAMLYMATDEFKDHYSIVAMRLPQVKRGHKEGKEISVLDPIVLFSAELRASPDNLFADRLKKFYKDNRVSVVLTYSKVEADAVRLRKICGFKAIFLESVSHENASTTLNDWFGRRTKEGKPSIIFDGDCSEFLGEAYYPARVSVLEVLRYYDERTRTAGLQLPRKKMTMGY